MINTEKIKTTLVILFITLITISISCSKDADSEKDILSSKNASKTIELIDYGFYHNEALSLYYKKYKGIEGKTSSQIIDEMTTELKIKYPEQFKDVNLNDVKKAFKMLIRRTSMQNLFGIQIKMNYMLLIKYLKN